MSHDVQLLRVANACHPEMADAERRDILRRVGDELGWPDWLPPVGKRCGPRHAMQMLRALEQRHDRRREESIAAEAYGDEGEEGDEGGGRRRGAALLVLVLGLWILWWSWWAGRTRKKIFPPPDMYG